VTSAGWSEDPVVRKFREQISDADRVILATLNRRIELVGRLRDYKRERGYPFVDRDRESALLDELERANTGPLSSEGLRELYAGLLDLVKRELEPSPAEHERR